MFENRFRDFGKFNKETLVLCFWILAVILIFKVIVDRQIASLIAGAGFVLIPGAILINDCLKIKSSTKSITNQMSHVVLLKLFTIIIFLTTCALPILISRIVFWGIPFEEIQIQISSLIFKPKILHSYSNLIYFAMVIIVGIENFTNYKNKNR